MASKTEITEIKVEGGKKIITKTTEIVSSSRKEGEEYSEASSLNGLSLELEKELPTASYVYTSSETKSFSIDDAEGGNTLKINELQTEQSLQCTENTCITVDHATAAVVEKHKDEDAQGSSEASSSVYISSELQEEVSNVCSSVQARSETKTCSTKDTKKSETTKTNEVQSEMSGKGAKERTQENSSSSSSDESDEDFAQQCLEAHNKCRKKHGVPPLKLNKKMCKSSKEWAQHLMASKSLTRKEDEEYGENIYRTIRKEVNGASAVDKWYSEAAKYPFGREPHNAKDTARFSQVIWAGSKELGVGYGKTECGQTYVVANYKPRGNRKGQYRRNVPPPK